MKRAVHETLILWAGLLLCGGLALLLLALSPSRHWLWSQTGETAFLPQVKGLTDLASGLLRPRLHLATQQTTAHANVSPFGINVFLEQEVEPTKREQAVLMAAQAGFQWLRQEFPWEDIEIHAKGDFEDRRHDPARSAWEKYDRIVALADQYGMGLIVRISNPPAWSRAEGNEVGSYAPPDSYDDFADFAGAVAGRYQGRIRYYQLWNEPNIYPEWGVYPTDPVAYTALLKAGRHRHPCEGSRRGHYRRCVGRHHRSGRYDDRWPQFLRSALPAEDVRRRRGAVLRCNGDTGLWLMVRAD